MKDINQLKEALTAKYQEAYAIREQIEAIESAGRYEEYMGKYANKFFKYENSYSCPDDKDRWFIYSAVLHITDNAEIKLLSFELSPEGIFKVDASERLVPTYLLEQEISQEEFLKALEEFSNGQESLFSLIRPSF